MTRTQVYSIVGSIAMLSASAFANNVDISTLINPGMSGWTTDRRDPAAFNEDTATFGFATAHNGISGAQQDADSFYNYQGKQTAITSSGSTQSVSWSLYVDPTAWAGQTINTGIWVVGQDSTNTVSAYNIIAYRQDANNAYLPGFYDYDYQVTGNWIYMGAANPGWNGLKAELNVGTGYSNYLNGNLSGGIVDTATVNNSAIIYNNRNSGQNYDTFVAGAAVAAPLPSAAGMGALSLIAIGGVSMFRKKLKIV